MTTVTIEYKRLVFPFVFICGAEGVGGKGAWGERESGWRGLWWSTETDIFSRNIETYDLYKGEKKGG